MTLTLTPEERRLAEGTDGTAMAMRIVVETARILDAERLIPIVSAHIDGALYHGDSGTHFAEALVEAGARVSVPATLNVGSLDLLGCSRVRLEPAKRAMAKRMMDAYVALGCQPSWTCAPYQSGHRPALGAQVAWGESNAVAFCNSVLGARTNRYGDLIDIACAITGLAPDYGLHQTQNRRAELLLDASGLPAGFLASEIAWPVLGTLFGSIAGERVAALAGMPQPPDEDALKAFGAAAASSGAVGLFHIIGVTPEAATIDDAFQGEKTPEAIALTPQMAREAQTGLSTASGAAAIDAVAIGSPHLSEREFHRLEGLLGGRGTRVPIYACTGRDVVAQLERDGRRGTLEEQGVVIVADTCIVVTPILPEIGDGVLMTNSGKFAHYTPGNTGYGVIYGSLSECVESAIAGKPVLSGALL